MKTMEKSEFEKLNAFGTGRDNTAYARYFIGRSYLNPLTKPQDISSTPPPAAGRY